MMAPSPDQLLALLTGILGTIRPAYELLKDIKKAPANKEELEKELGMVVSLNDHLEADLKSILKDKTPQPESWLKATNDFLLNEDTVASSLSTRIRKARGLEKKRYFYKRCMWALDDKEISGMITKLHNLRGTLGELLASEHRHRLNQFEPPPPYPRSMSSSDEVNPLSYQKDFNTTFGDYEHGYDWDADYPKDSYQRNSDTDLQDSESENEGSVSSSGELERTYNSYSSVTDRNTTSRGTYYANRIYNTHSTAVQNQYSNWNTYTVTTVVGVILLGIYKVYRGNI